jgi:hypothetical protein
MSLPMRHFVSLAMFCCLAIATPACTSSIPQPKPQKTEPPVGQVFQPRMDQSCQEALPIVGGGIVDYIYFSDVEKLTQSSDLVVVGQPTTELGPDTTLRSMKAQKTYEPFNIPINQSLVVSDASGGTTADWTLTGFKVEQTIKGNLPAKNLQILEPGIVISGKSVPKHIRVIDSEAYTPLRKGKRYMLFLKKTLPTPTSFFDPDITFSTALHQGKYNLDGGDCPEANFIKANEHQRKLLGQVKTKYPRLFS